MPNDLKLPPLPKRKATAWFHRGLPNFDEYGLPDEGSHALYTAEQLRERDRQIVELCAKVCEEQWAIDGTRTAQEFATAIRALIGEQT